MSIDLAPLAGVNRVLFAIPLAPIQGRRFQPTGFPALGAAIFQTRHGTSLLVESPQSMANRLELTIWDEAANDLKPDFRGLSHVRVNRKGSFLTDSILESHRINSPYILEGSDKTFISRLRNKFAVMETGPIDRRRLAEVLLKYDIGSLLHGVFLAKKELAGGRLRISRAVEAFIEADGVRAAASGGVKNDHVNPSGDTKAGFGNVPFARDEFTAETLTLYVKIDLAQIRGYGLGENVENLLVLLALYKVRSLLAGNLRLRTACDLVVAVDSVTATLPPGFSLPSSSDLMDALRPAIVACGELMTVSEVTFNDELKKGKEKEGGESDDAGADED